MNRVRAPVLVSSAAVRHSLLLTHMELLGAYHTGGLQIFPTPSLLCHLTQQQESPSPARGCLTRTVLIVSLERS
jgi:hypothetical protein